MADKKASVGRQAGCGLGLGHGLGHGYRGGVGRGCGCGFGFGLGRGFGLGFGIGIGILPHPPPNLESINPIISRAARLSGSISSILVTTTLAFNSIPRFR